MDERGGVPAQTTRMGTRVFLPVHVIERIVKVLY